MAVQSVAEVEKRARPIRRAQRAEVAVRIPLLENGDRLTCSEFERRYEAMPRVNKAELIEGVVRMPSPVSVSHSESHANVMAWLGAYAAATLGARLADNATVRLDADNEVQPDALLRLEPEAGGHSRISADDYVEGAPELIVEVASSSAAYDLHDKLHVYRRNGVQEYAVWQVLDERLDWFRLDEGRYMPVEPGPDGVIRSQVFPGLCLAVESLLDGDLAGVLAELQKGLAAPEHAAFVERLRASHSKV